MSDELLHLIGEQIRAQGPLRFDDFMSLALYGDPYGYYRSHVPGADSDYQTAATLTPWFGRLLCRRLQQMWTELGSPDEFTVAEIGGGAGDLAAAALAAAEHGELGAALRWTLVEPMPAVADVQASRLGRDNRVRWTDDLDAAGPVVGVILANEVLDNFPFRILEVGRREPVEVRVDLAGGRLVETLVPLGPEAESDLLAPAAHLEVGDRYEVGPAVAGWAASAAAALEAGYVLVLDYGDEEPDLWIKRPAGSMVTYRQGRLGLDPFEEPGRTDITAHVNFSHLRRCLVTHGIGSYRPVRQRDWLSALGLQEAVADLREQQDAAREQGRHADQLSLLSERSKLQTLGAGTMGDYLVLEGRKDLVQ